MENINNMIIIIFILLLSCNIEIKGNRDNYMKFRNYSLRLLLSDEYADLKKIIEVQNIKIKFLKNITSKKLLKIYDKALSKYYDVNIMYNTLSEDEKTIFETILSLCY